MASYAGKNAAPKRSCVLLKRVELLLLAVCQFFVRFETIFHVFFRMFVESIGLFREAPFQGCIADFAVHEFLQRYLRILGVERERVLAFLLQIRVEAVEVQ